MQIVSIGDNLHEMSDPTKNKKMSAENFTQHAKC